MACLSTARKNLRRAVCIDMLVLFERRPFCFYHVSVLFLGRPSVFAADVFVFFFCGAIMNVPSWHVRVELHHPPLLRDKLLGVSVDIFFR